MIILVCTAAVSVPYAGMMILGHDAIHRTLTGIPWVDEIVPRIFSWPVCWFHGTYAEIHKLHHKMNGQNLKDPERVQYTVSEFQKANEFRKFFIKHQWFFNLFVFAGLGLIFNVVVAAFRFWHNSKSVRRALVTDVFGIVFFQTILFWVFSFTSVAYHWVITFLILQYVVGMILCLRGHIEHYGLWGKGHHFYDTQVWTCRNIVAGPIISWYFNYLNHHSIHHAFPLVPFYQLQAAEAALAKVYQDNNVHYPFVDDGYFKTAWKLAQTPTLIDDSKIQQPSFGKNPLNLALFR